MKLMKLTVLIALVFGLTGCGVSNSDKITRTYPESFNFETVTIQQLQSINKPDSVNIQGVVFDIYQCPEDAICAAPDGILVSENLPPSDTLFITTVEPKQFQKNNRYAISLSVTKRETRKLPDVHILGYSFVE